MSYKIGQVLDYRPPRGITSSEDIAPAWFALLAPPQKERALREFLRERGVFAFFPSENKVRTIRGKRQEIERPIVSRHVYAQFRQAPQWDVMKDQRLISGVICHGSQPIKIHRDVIRHLQGLTVEAQRLAEAKADMLRVRPGDKARITAGPLSGFLVDVGSVNGGTAWFNFITGGRGSADLHTLERVVPQCVAT